MIQQHEIASVKSADDAVMVNCAITSKECFQKHLVEPTRERAERGSTHYSYRVPNKVLSECTVRYIKVTQISRSCQKCVLEDKIIDNHVFNEDSVVHSFTWAGLIFHRCSKASAISNEHPVIF